MEAPADDAVVTLPVFIAFDLLVTRGRDVRVAAHRRKVMEDEIDGSPILPARRLPEDGPVPAGSDIELAEK